MDVRRRRDGRGGPADTQEPVHDPEPARPADGRRRPRDLPRPRPAGDQIRARHLPRPLGDFVAERNPALRFLCPDQTLELHPDDARAPRRPARAARRRHRRRRDVADRPPWPCASGCSTAPRFLIEGDAENGANLLDGATVVIGQRRRDEPAEEPTSRTAPRPREVVAGGPAGRRRRVRRGELDPGRQVDRDLRGDPADRADDPAARAQAARPLPGALRAQPGRPDGPDAAARRRAQAAHARSPTSPTTRCRYLWAIAPALVILSATATLAIIPFGDVTDGVGFYGIDVSIGILYAFAFGSISFYGLLLGGWASRLEVQLHGRDALGRPADLLRDLDGAGPARRDHDGRLAQPGRHRQRPGRHRLVRHPAVRRLHHLHGRRLRRDQPRRRSTCPRPTPSWSPATTPSTAACASAPSSWPSTWR